MDGWSCMDVPLIVSSFILIIWKVFLLNLSVLFLFTEAVCPTGWIDTAQNCYITLPETRTWASARRYCTSLIEGSHLSSVLSECESEQIRHNINLQDGVWIGLTNPLNPQWVDGSAYSWSNWWTPPADRSMCVFLNIDAKWGTGNCTITKQAICKIKDLGTTDPCSDSDSEGSEVISTLNNILQSSWFHWTLAGLLLIGAIAILTCICCCCCGPDCSNMQYCCQGLCCQRRIAHCEGHGHGYVYSPPSRGY